MIWLLALAFSLSTALAFVLGYYVGKYSGYAVGRRDGFIRALKQAVAVEQPTQRLLRALLPAHQVLEESHS